MLWQTRVAWAVGFTALLTLPGGSAEAQRAGARIGRFEVPGFDFSPDGAWRKRTNQIRAARRSMLRSGALSALNASGPSGSRVTGTYNVPVVLIEYSNSPGPFPVAQYQDVLFNPAPVTRPYSVKTYYEQISNSNITLNGTVFDWTTTDQVNTYYEDGCNGIGIITCANPLPNGVSSRFRDLIIEVLGKADDGSINWGQFDNDGPDATPNSGDDDGRVDFVTFIQPDVDGACGTAHIWAHRFSLIGLNGSAYVTSTARAGGGFIQINDYTIQSGQGGNGACSAGQIMPIGTVAHETGHAFGLPDLYDTDRFDTFNSGEGVGEWGLMASGNYARPYSPARYEAWSLAEMGWVTLDTLTASRSVTLNPVQTSDTVLYFPVAGTDEYFLLENRDSLLSDTAQMSSAFSRKKSPGLLIWHIDQGQVTAGSPSNSVNDPLVNGVALEQADGLNQLRISSGGNRGDAGDSYPGSSVNRKYSFTSNPAARNNQGGFAGFAIDSIYRNASGVPGVPSPVVFRFLKRERSVFTTNRNGASITVNAVPTTRFDDVVAPGDQVNLDVTSPQTINFGRTQLTFASWSDGGASAHPIVSGATPDTVIASFTANHKVHLVTAPTGGTVTSDIGGNPNLVVGAFVQEGVPVTLTATPNTAETFIRYQGDTTTTNPVLVLPMGRPYSLAAVFTNAVTIVTQDAVNSLLGAACAQNPCLNSQQLTYLDQSGNNDGVYNLGDFLAYADRSGLNPSSEAMRRVLSQPTVSVPLTSVPSQPKER